MIAKFTLHSIQISFKLNIWRLEKCFVDLILILEVLDFIEVLLAYFVVIGFFNLASKLI